MSEKRGYRTGVCTLEEAKRHFNEYYDKNTNSKASNFRAKLFDKRYQKKPKFVLKPNTPGSEKYLLPKGPKTFDMVGVDSFDEGEEFTLNDVDGVSKTYKSLGATYKKVNDPDHEKEIKTQKGIKSPNIYGPRIPSQKSSGSPGILYSKYFREKYLKDNKDRAFLVKKRWSKYKKNKILGKEIKSVKKLNDKVLDFRFFDDEENGFILYKYTLNSELIENLTLNKKLLLTNKIVYYLNKLNILLNTDDVEKKIVYSETDEEGDKINYIVNSKYNCERFVEIEIINDEEDIIYGEYTPILDLKTFLVHLKDIETNKYSDSNPQPLNELLENLSMELDLTEIDNFLDFKKFLSENDPVIQENKNTFLNSDKVKEIEEDYYEGEKYLSLDDSEDDQDDSEDKEYDSEDEQGKSEDEKYDSEDEQGKSEDEEDEQGKSEDEQYDSEDEQGKSQDELGKIEHETKEQFLSEPVVSETNNPSSSQTLNISTLVDEKKNQSNVLPQKEVSSPESTTSTIEGIDYQSDASLPDFSSGDEIEEESDTETDDEELTLGTKGKIDTPINLEGGYKLSNITEIGETYLGEQNYYDIINNGIIN